MASVMSFYFKDEVLPYYGGGTAAARNKGNDYMYWRLMCHATERGVRLFDYGRSKEGTGSFSFKKNWGFTPEPLYYEYYLVNATEIPELNPLNPKYQLMINCWKKATFMAEPAYQATCIEIFGIMMMRFCSPHPSLLPRGEGVNFLSGSKTYDQSPLPMGRNLPSISRSVWKNSAINPSPSGRGLDEVKTL